jgi:hypothetical protein
MDYVFYISDTSIYMTSIDNYAVLKKYNYSKKIKRIMNKQIHQVLQKECGKIIKKVQDIINITKYIQC